MKASVKRALSVLLFLYAVLYPVLSIGQEVKTDTLNVQKNAVSVFIEGYGNMDYIRREIQFVNFVREPQQAQVYILITEQSTGGGGSRYKITFTGQKEYTGAVDTLYYTSVQNATTDEERAGVVRVLKLGLIRYVAKTPPADYISISYRYTPRQIPAQIKDKWNYWVFSMRFGSNLSGQKQTKDQSFDGSLSANRVTEAWKIDMYASNYYTEDSYKTSFGTIKSFSRSSSFSALVVKSINNHWSIGMSGGGSSSLYSNNKRSCQLSPAIEYDIYPYSVSERRDVRIVYRIGLADVNYREETIYFKTRETLLNEQLSLSANFVEKWGSISSSLNGSHYFQSLQQNNVAFYSSISLRIYQGLSLNISGDISFIHDQLSLPRSNRTIDQVLLRRSELETQYSYFAMIGLGYTFGSRYNNIVNPRF